MNTLERAVIEAARKLTYSTAPPELRAGLRDAVLALDEHEREFEARPCFQTGEHCATHDRHISWCEARK